MFSKKYRTRKAMRKMIQKMYPNLDPVAVAAAVYPTVADEGETRWQTIISTPYFKKMGTEELARTILNSASYHASESGMMEELEGSGLSPSEQYTIECVVGFGSPVMGKLLHDMYGL